MRQMTMVLSLLAVLLGVFALFSLFLYLRQERFLFEPVPSDPQLARHWLAQRVQIPVGDHWIEGWWIDNPAAANSVTVLYFGGNAEDVLTTAATAERIGARRLLVTNYRGYGTTPGRPGQAALYADALQVYDYAAQTAGVIPTSIIAMGRSMGTGVATMLAAERPLRAAILVTPYDSILRVAERHYPAFPVKWLLRHPFPSLEFAMRATAPVLILAAERDLLIPSSHAQRLADAWAGPHEIHILSGMAHNNIEQHPEYYSLISNFINRLR
jgi:fermentation-respiration switch protein FrsA (DUF1100 family)